MRAPLSGPLLRRARVPQKGRCRRYEPRGAPCGACGAAGQEEAARAARCDAAVGLPMGMGVERWAAAGGDAALLRPETLSDLRASAATSTLAPSPLLLPPAAAPQEAVAPSLLPDLSDRFSLSTSRVWNLLRLDVDSLLGGLEPADLHGDCRLLVDVREDVLEKWRDVDECMCIAWERCAGEPTTKSLPGDVDREGPSDLHSDTFLLRQDCGLEHSELRRDRPLL